MKVKIDDLRLDGGTQPRVLMDGDTISEYQEAMKLGSKFPPVVVFFDGKKKWLADGFHRVYAAQENCATEIDAELRNGTRRDAILYSVGANADHGKRRTNADKQKAVETLLRDSEWCRKSDEWISQMTKVARTTVLNRRKHLETTCQIDRLERRGGLDGKTRKLPERKSSPTSSVGATTPGQKPNRSRLTERDDLADSREPRFVETVGSAPIPGKLSCAPKDRTSATYRDAVDAWVTQGLILYQRLEDGGRKYMLTSWEERMAALEIH